MCLLHLLVKFISWISKEVNAKISKNHMYSLNKSTFNSKLSFSSLLISFIISYTLIFGVYKSAFLLTHPSVTNEDSNSLAVSTSNLLPPLRMLTQKTSSFGEILSSIDRPVYSLVFSPKKNLLYVSFLDNKLEVYDVSNLNKPRSIKSFRTPSGEILLPPDENTVLIYDGQMLVIYVYEDVSKSVFFNSMIQINQNAAQNDYRPLLRSSDGNLLFLGGSTFQIYDTTDSRSPKSLYKSENCTENPVTSIALSKDDKTLFLTFVNSSLRILDINNPRDPVKLSQFQIDGVPTLIDLFQKINQIVLASYQVNTFEIKHELFVQRIDVKDLKNPKLMSMNYTSFCQDEVEGYILETWTRCVSSKVKVYNEDDEQIMFYDESSLQLMSFSKQLSNDPIILIPDSIDSPKSIGFWPGSNIAFIGASRLLTVKLGLEVIPNKQLPLQANILWQTYLNEIEPHRTVVTSNERIAFMVGRQNSKKGENSPWNIRYFQL